MIRPATSVAHDRRRNVPPAVALLFALVLALGGCSGDGPGTEEQEAASPAPELTPSLQPEDDPGTGQARVSQLSQHRAREGRQALAGMTLEIPAIGVATPLVALGLNEDRSMQVPSDFGQAGWYQYSVIPGDPGPAVIAGHVDSRSGPAVFFHLADLSPGDEIHVRAADGTATTFVVQRVEQHPKDDFPTDAVYGDTPGPELRLITCGGVFDRSQRAHRDNVIVYAAAV